FKPQLEPKSEGVSLQQVASMTFGGLNTIRLVFVNGHFAAGLSSDPSAEGVKVMSLASAMRDGSALLERHLSHYAPIDQDSFSALNAAFFQDGAIVHIGQGVVVERPIHLLFITN